MKGKPAKRITFTLTIEYSGGNHFTYEKELLTSRKNSRFYKTNHPCMLIFRLKRLFRKGKPQTNFRTHKSRITMTKQNAEKGSPSYVIAEFIYASWVWMQRAGTSPAR
jgi:hypothetical protein